MRKITILIKEPGRSWHPAEVEDTLPVYQKIVGGYIEGLFTSPDGLHFFGNEEGKLLGLPVNFTIPGDIIVGTVFACRTDGEEFASVLESDLDLIRTQPERLPYV